MNSQSFPGGLDDANLIFWLKANQGVDTTSTTRAVTSWNDQSSTGGGNNATQSTISLQPIFQISQINSLPSLRFDGVDDIIEIANDDDIHADGALTNISARSVFIVIETTGDLDDDNGIEAIYTQGDIAGGDGLAIYIDDDAGAGGTLYVGGFEDGIGLYRSTSVAEGNTYLIALIYDGSSTSITGYLNNVAFGSATAGALTTVDLQTTTSTIGGVDGSGFVSDGSVSTTDAYFSGDIAEIVYYNSALNEVEQGVVSNYLASKYAITIGTDIFSESGGFSTEVAAIGSDGADEIVTMQSSSGALTLDANSSFTGTQAVALGHNNTDHSVVSTDLPASIPFRYDRTWVIESSGSPTVDYTLSFNSDEAGFGDPDQAGSRTVSDYVILYRATVGTGTFTDLSASASLADPVFVSNQEVVFTVPNANLADGEYTLGIIDDLTYYSFISGNWEDSNNWTLDPSGTTFVNPSGDFPSDATNDEAAIILNGRTMTATGNNLNLSSVEVQSGGVVVLGTTTGHDFGTITGEGTISIEADNFPTGTTTGTNGFSTSVGGTLEFTGSSAITISNSSTYNNLEISNTNTVTLTVDYTLNGNFNVASGSTFQINDTGTTPLTISVAGNTTVSGAITVGTGNATTVGSENVQTFHQFDLDGDLTINSGGSLDFTNLSAVNLTTYPTDGVVELIVNNTLADQTINCNGAADFYRIEVDKGSTSRTLTIAANSTANFDLFGRVAFAQDFTTEGSIANPRALGLESGKLVLSDNIVITELSDGTSDGDLSGVLIDGGELAADGCSGANCVESYIIDSDAELSLTSDASLTSSRSAGMHIFGIFRVADDAIVSKGDGRCSLILDGSGTISVEGGNGVSVSQIHQFDENARGTFNHFAGTITVAPSFNDETIVDVLDIENYALLGLPFSDMSIVMADNIPTNPTTLNIDIDGNAPGTDICADATVAVDGINYDGDDLLGMNAGGNNEALAIFIGIDDDNASLTGGTINLVIFDNVDAIINSTISLYNFSMRTFESPDAALTCAGGNAEFQLSEVDAIAGISPAQVIQPVNTLNNFTLVSAGVGFGGGDGTDYDPGGQDLQVGGNFVLEDNVRYDPDATTLFMNGSGDQLISVNEPDPAPQGGGEGILDYGFNKVVLNGSGTVTLDGIEDRGGTMNSFGVREAFVIGDGVTFRDGGVTVLIGDSLTNNGTHTGSGFLQFEDPTDGGEGNNDPGGANGIYEIISDGTGIFGGLRMNSGGEFAQLSGDITITDSLYLEAGLIDIGTHQLTLDSDTATIVGPNGAQVDTYSVTEFIRTDGNASDGGVRFYVDGATANPAAFTVPIGTDAGGADVYTPMNIDLESVVDDGYVQVAAVDAELATTDTDPLSDMVTYYWRIQNSDFTTLPTVTTLVLTYDDGDAEDLDGVGGVEEASFIPGYVEDNDDTDGDGSNFSNIYEDELAAGGAAAEDGVDEGNNTITFNGPDDVGFELFNGNFTAGEQDRFEGDPEVYYSRTTGTFVGTFIAGSTNWEDPSNWSTVELFGAAASDYPQEGDIAIIGPDVSDGDFEFMIYGISDDFGGGATGNITIAQLIIDNLSGAGFIRLKIDNDATVDFGVVSGNDEIQPLITPTLTPTINGDFGDFVANAANGAQFSYLGGGGAGTLTLPATITEYPILRLEASNGDNQIFELPSAIQAYDVTVDGTGDLRLTHDLTVTNNFQLGSFRKGDLIFGGDNGAITLTIGNDFELDDEAENDVSVDNSASGLEHRMIINGDLNLDDTNDGLEGFDLFTDNATGDNVILEFQGSSDAFFTNIDANGVTPELYRLVLNKDASTNQLQINDNFTLEGPTNTVTKALELTQGTLIFDETNLDITLSSGGGDFQIPSTSVFQVNSGTARVTAAGSGDGNGLDLSGSLILNGTDANVILSDGASGDNYLEFNTTGSATLTINQGELVIGSQLRQQTTNTNGILNYTQTGGTVIIGANTGATYLDDRAVFSLPNTSSFTFNNDTEVPTLAIVSAQANPTDGTFVVSSGATINMENAADVVIDFGFNGSVNGVTYTSVDNTTFDINAAQAIPRVQINDFSTGGGTENTLRTRAQTLTVSDSLLIGADAEFQTNGFGLNMTGDLINDGIFTPNNDNVTFAGTVQTISGATTSNNFYDLTINSSTSFTLVPTTTLDLDVDNNLSISDGTFDDAGQFVDVQGDLTLSDQATLTGSTTGGIRLNNGTGSQSIFSSSGSVNAHRLIIDNSSGVDLETEATINSALVLNSGVLEIGDNLLSISSGAAIEDNAGVTTSAGSFGSNRMISVNGSIPINGVERAFAGTGLSENFFYPIGVGTDYTPVDINVNTTENGSFSVRPISSQHPSVTGDMDALNYYWIVNTTDNGSDGELDNFSGDITFSYLQADIIGSESIYANARLDVSNSPPTWQQILPTTNDINTSANTFSWYDQAGSESALVTDNNFTGEYTIGEEASIPDQLVVYTSTANTDFTLATNWQSFDGTSTVNDDGPPSQGSLVVIGAGTTVDMGGLTNINSFSTTINGTLDVGSAAGNSFGTVDGTGTLLIQGNIPLGGNFDAFFTTTGGTLEASGPGDYTISSDFTAFGGLTISGGGTKSIPAVDYSIGSAGINITGGTTLNNDLNDRDINIQNGGGITVSNGTFNAGTSGVDITVSGDFANQTNGTFTATGASLDIAGNFTVSGGTYNAGVGSINVAGDVTYSGGTFNNGNGTLELDGTGAQQISGNFTTTNKLYNFTINKAAENVTIDSGSPNTVAVDNTLTLTSGNVITDASNSALLLVCNGATIVVDEDPTTNISMIDGALDVELPASGEETFPVGKSNTLNTFNISNTTAGVSQWRVEYFTGAATGSASVTVDNFDITSTEASFVNRNEYWEVELVSGSASDALVSLDVSGVNFEASDFTDGLFVMQYDEGVTDNWIDLGIGTTSGTTNNGQVGAANAVSFALATPILFTSGDDDANPLPVELLDFSAEAVDNKVELTWSTLSELNNDFFEVMHSTDGVSFTSIGLVEGNGTTNELITYNFTHSKPALGDNYYQLKQVDFDGTETLYSIVKVFNDYYQASMAIKVYPNPTTQDNISLSISTGDNHTSINVRIIDQNGRVYYQRTMNGSLNIDDKVDPDLNMVPGIYYMIVNQGDQIQRQKIIIR